MDEFKDAVLTNITDTAAKHLYTLLKKEWNLQKPLRLMCGTEEQDFSPAADVTLPEDVNVHVKNTNITIVSKDKIEVLNRYEPINSVLQKLNYFAGNILEFVSLEEELLQVWFIRTDHARITTSKLNFDGNTVVPGTFVMTVCCLGKGKIQWRQGVRAWSELKVGNVAAYFANAGVTTDLSVDDTMQMVCFYGVKGSSTCTVEDAVKSFKNKRQASDVQAKSTAASSSATTHTAGGPGAGAELVASARAPVRVRAPARAPSAAQAARPPAARPPEAAGPVAARPVAPAAESAAAPPPAAPP
eukprot:2505860-Pleurochrysis_carterae.AAC.1